MNLLMMNNILTYYKAIFQNHINQMLILDQNIKEKERLPNKIKMMKQMMMNLLIAMKYQILLKINQIIMNKMMKVKMKQKLKIKLKTNKKKRKLNL